MSLLNKASWTQFPLSSTLWILHLVSSHTLEKAGFCALYFLSFFPLTLIWLPSLCVFWQCNILCPHLFSPHRSILIVDHVLISETVFPFTIHGTLFHCLFVFWSFYYYYYYCTCANIEILILMSSKFGPDTLLFVLHALSLSDIILLLARKSSIH